MIVAPPVLSSAAPFLSGATGVTASAMSDAIAGVSGGAASDVTVAPSIRRAAGATTDAGASAPASETNGAISNVRSIMDSKERGVKSATHAFSSRVRARLSFLRSAS